MQLLVGLTFLKLHYQLLCVKMPYMYIILIYDLKIVSVWIQFVACLRSKMNLKLSP